LAQAESEWVLFGQGMFPQSDAYTAGYGGGIQYRTPAPLLPETQLGLSIGYGGWNVKDWGYDGLLGMTLDGTAADLPLGASLIYSFRPADRLKIGLEGGFQYHLVQSDCDLNIYRIMWWPVNITNELEIDNVWTASLGLNVEYEIAPLTSLLLGAGYAWDLDRENFKVLGFELPLEQGFGGGFLRAGMVFVIP